MAGNGPRGRLYKQSQWAGGRDIPPFQYPRSAVPIRCPWYKQSQSRGVLSLKWPVSREQSRPAAGRSLSAWSPGALPRQTNPILGAPGRRAWPNRTKRSQFGGLRPPVAPRSPCLRGQDSCETKPIGRVAGWKWQVNKGPRRVLRGFPLREKTPCGVTTNTAVPRKRSQFSGESRPKQATSSCQ